MSKDLKSNLQIYVLALINSANEHAEMQIDNAVKLGMISKNQSDIDRKELKLLNETLVDSFKNPVKFSDFLAKNLSVPDFIKTCEHPTLRQIFDFKMSPHYEKIMKTDSDIKKYVDNIYEYSYDPIMKVYGLNMKNKSTPKLGKI